MAQSQRSGPAAFGGQQCALKRLVATMSEGGLSAKTIDNYTQVVKMVVASAVDAEGEEIYPRKWNHEFIDMPIVEKSKQNTPAFSSDVMTGLAAWKDETGKDAVHLMWCGRTEDRGGAWHRNRQDIAHPIFRL